jgi:ATP-dependent exoDNAse (exonuclease V) beta subunit
MKTLTLYRSSAGSGKTFTLVKAYLELVLNQPPVYRHTLALTFTNKATAEMKTRILDNLQELADGKATDMQKALLADNTGKLTEANLAQQAQQVLVYLLHDYSRFSVSTIDSFFNRVVRAFARELGLPATFELATDKDQILSEVIDQLMLQYGRDEQLRAWLQDFAFEKLADDKSWNVKRDLQNLGSELFSERYQQIQQTLQTGEGDSRERIGRVLQDMKQQTSQFRQELQRRLKAILEKVRAHDLRGSDFKNQHNAITTAEKLNQHFDTEKVQSLERHLNKLESEQDLVANSASSGIQSAISACADHGLWDDLMSLRDWLPTAIPHYYTARHIQKNAYPFGVLADLNQVLQQYRREHELLLIADLNNLLKQVTQEAESPFIYEKVGSTYQHFLLDEFQDTSNFQWDNLQPLLVNAMSSGYENLVVGDVKQSIYRWRGGNPDMLVNKLPQDLHGLREQIREQNLQVNRRSYEGVVRFNNALFQELPEFLAQEHGEQGAFIKEAYQEVAQQWLPEKADSGYVRVSFLPSVGKQYTEHVQDSLLETIRSLEGKGYSYREIAILVRDNAKAKAWAERLTKADPPIPVLSSNSLVIGQSPKVQLLVHAMQYLYDPTDDLARAIVLNDYYCYFRPDGEQDPAVRFRTARDPELTEEALPGALTQQQAYLQKLPLYDLGEALIRIFDLSHRYDAYLQRFLDLLLDYARQRQGDLDQFLEWWEEKGYKETIQVPAGENAIRIETVHQTKGLEFLVVLLPDISWDMSSGSDDWLWEAPQHPDFQQMAYYPVNPTKNLQETYFSHAYEREAMLAGLDSLNLLYVACTRATEALYLWAPYPLTSRGEPASGLHSRVYLALQGLRPGELTDGAKEEQVLEWGSLPERYPKQPEAQTAPDAKPPFNSWRGKLNIRPRGQDVLKLYDGAVASRINQGILMHGILARIKEPADVQQAVEQVYQEGLIAAGEQEGLVREVHRLLALPSVKPWFEPKDWNIRNEQELLLPNGQSYRPDRVMTRGNQARVIDYKTGEPKPADEQQVQQYKALLEGVGYQDVAAYLFYLESEVIQQIA